MKYLIINADDYGYSPKFDKGILELADKKIITSVSVMMKRRPIKPAGLRNKKISIGLHLELKEKDTLKEIEGQLKKFIKRFGQPPSHLDGHQHIHLTAENLPNVIKIAKKYGLPIRSRFPEDRKAIKKSGIKTPGNFISWHPKRKQMLWERLKNIKSKTAEIVCHPGYYDCNCTSSYNKQRRMELTILKSKNFRNAIKKFKKINYHEL